MPGSFSDWAEAKILDHIFGGVAWTVPSLYLGYTLSSSGETGSGTEPVGGGYSRVSAPPTVWSTATAGSLSNIAEIGCPKATGNQGTVTGLILADSSVGGNIITYIPLAGAIVVEIDDALIVPSGAITHTFSSGGFTTYQKNLILNHVYKSMAMGIEATLFGGYMTSTPSDSAPGTEPGNGYQRLAVNNNLTSFGVTSGDGKLTAIPLTFPQSTASQGSATHFGWWNQSSGGQFIAYGALGQSKSISTGDQLALPAGDVKHTLD